MKETEIVRSPFPPPCEDAAETVHPTDQVGANQTVVGQRGVESIGVHLKGPFRQPADHLLKHRFGQVDQRIAPFAIVKGGVKSVASCSRRLQKPLVNGTSGL
jgi:hypothetical protein